MTTDPRWTPSAPARTYPKGDRRRAEIIQAAFRAFAAGGYRGASMLQIAAACGVSRGALNHHFPSKELLLAAVLEERDRVNGDLFFTGSNPAEDGIDYFERLVRVVAHNASQREIVSLFATLSAEAADAAHPAHEYFVSRYRWLRADISDALRDIDSRGLLRTGVALEGLEADIVALIDGLQIQWLLDPTGVDMPGRLRLRIDELLASPLP